MSKETAVEWLFKQLWEESKDKMTWYHIMAKAHAMEKEQHGRTWDDALAQVGKRTVWARAMCDFDEYYEETYKK